MPGKNDIIYPILLECCQFAPDIFWENIFEELAYGRAPYGAYISKNFLCCSFKKKEFSYKIEKKDPKILYNDISLLLTSKLGIFSQQEKILQKHDFKDVEDNIKLSRQKWSTIRKKNIKDLLIEIYVIKMKNKYSLTVMQSRQLLSIILIGMTFKTITANDIEYSNGEITNINGIKFEKKKIIVEKELYNSNNIPEKIILIERKEMIDAWHKYIKELAK